MSNVRLSRAVFQFGQSILEADSEVSDGQLLSRFTQSQDEAAFAELVRRLGPMVMGVCRRITADTHLAEDAFQAAFLVLARRSADVSPREAVRGWLYGVAARTAQKARVMSARHRSREVLTPAPPDEQQVAIKETDSEALRMLDEEIGELPDHLRAAVVLCELEGVSRKDAAARLEIPQGTLASRLAKARKMLAVRLLNRGVAISAALLDLAFERLAAAPVPTRLLSATASLADKSHPLSTSITELSQGVLKTMYLTRLKLVVPCGLLLVLASWAASTIFGPGAMAGQPRALPAPASQAKPEDKTPQRAGPGILLLARKDGVIALTTDGKKVHEFTVPMGTHSGFAGCLSPDGKRAAFLVARDTPSSVEVPKSWPYKVVISKFDGTQPVVVEFPCHRPTLTWRSDGSQVVATKWSGEFVKSEDETVEYQIYKGVENVLIDPVTGKTEPLALPVGAWVLDSSRDGKTFLVKIFDGEKWFLGLAAKGDKEVKKLIKLKGWTGDFLARLSPDEKRVLYTDADPKDRDANKWGMSSLPYIFDLSTRKRTEVEDFPDNAVCYGLAWSPDGKQIAYTWEELHRDELKKDSLLYSLQSLKSKGSLVLADATGENPKRIISAKQEDGQKIFGSIDWR